MSDQLNPAAHIIAKFGSVALLAEALSVPHSTVIRWTYPREKGGTGGLIPTRRQQELLTLARDKGITLAHSDFFAAA